MAVVDQRDRGPSQPTKREASPQPASCEASPPAPRTAAGSSPAASSPRSPRSSPERVYAQRARSCAHSRCELMADDDATAIRPHHAPDDRPGRRPGPADARRRRCSRCAIAETSTGLYRARRVRQLGPEGRRTDFLYFDRQMLDFGKELQDRARAPTRCSTGGSPRSRRASPKATRRRSTVLAEDRFQDLRMTRRTRTFTDVTDADVIHADRRRPRPDAGRRASPARRTGCSPSSTRATSPSCASAPGRSTPSCGCDGSTLERASRARAADGTPVTLDYGNELREFTVLADLAEQRDECDGQRLGRRRQAGRSTRRADDSVVSGELNGGDSGAEHPRSRVRRAQGALAQRVAADQPTRRGRRPSAVQAARAPLPHRARDRRDEAGAAGRRDGDARRARAAVHRQLLPRRDASSCSTARRGCAPSLELERPGLGKAAVTTGRRAHRGTCRRLGRRRRRAGTASIPATGHRHQDPDGQGRVKVKLPWAPDRTAAYEAWARLATLDGGPEPRHAGSSPTPDDEVLVAFEGGDPRRPYVLGALWNGQDSPPESMDGAGNNYKKVVCSRNGVKITLDDTDGQEKLTLETPGGQKVTLQDGPGSVDDRGLERQLGQARVRRHHRHRLGQGDGQRVHGGNLGRNADRQRGDVQVQRRRAGRHGDHELRRQRLVHARRGEHLVSDARSCSG